MPAFYQNNNHSQKRFSHNFHQNDLQLYDSIHIDVQKCALQQTKTYQNMTLGLQDQECTLKHALYACILSLSRSCPMQDWYTNS